MRKFAFVIVLTLALFSSGCEKYSEVENHAYVIMLGVDLAEDDHIQISALIPKIAEIAARHPANLQFQSSGLRRRRREF